jgi:cysteine synthase A
MSAASAPLESIADVVGNTPVLRLRRLAPVGGAGVFVKLEALNPTGSVKDRFALAALRRAEADGRLRLSGRVVDATTGSFGISVAWACRRRGYGFTAVVPESASLERRAILRAYGAQLLLTPAREHAAGAIVRARELAARTRAVFLDQFSGIDESTLGAELVAQAGEAGGIEAFVAGAGTGSSFNAVARRLGAAFPKAMLVGVEPRNCTEDVEEGARAHRLQGLSPGVDGALDRELLDRIIAVPEERAYEVRARLAREEGLLAGVSTGANVAAALALAKELPAGARVFTLAVDSGERDLSLEEGFA